VESHISWNIIQLLHFIECDMMCYGAGRGQYCFSVLHNTSY
jgi:hypothetical protein